VFSINPLKKKTRSFSVICFSSSTMLSLRSLQQRLATLPRLTTTTTFWRGFASTTNDGNQNTQKRHGLMDFFQDGVALPKDPPRTGRAWRASELRQKSFEDLHKLWYILLKERNVLASQREEARRLGIGPDAFSNYSREIKCRKSMARIKTVLSERQIAYECALKRHRREKYAERRKKMFAEIAAATKAKKEAEAAAAAAKQSQ
jgi:ribosomal protein L29